MNTKKRCPSSSSEDAPSLKPCLEHKEDQFFKGSCKIKMEGGGKPVCENAIILQSRLRGDSHVPHVLWGRPPDLSASMSGGSLAP